MMALFRGRPIPSRLEPFGRPGPAVLDRPLSIYLDLIRVGAALAVFISHASKPGIGDAVLPNLTQFGVDAVTAFFVLSGFVISYTAENKEPRLSEFVVTRLARLWSVALPALVLAAVLSTIGARIGPEFYRSHHLPDLYAGSPTLSALVTDHPAMRAAIGAVFLNEAWSLRIVEFEDAPYWSLSYEFCYYIFFAAYFYLRSRSRVAALVGISLIFGPKILLLLPVWALGVGLQRFRFTIHHRLAWPCITMPIVTYLVAYHLDGARRSWRLDQMLPFEPGWSTHFGWQYGLGILVAINIVGFASLPRRHVILSLARPIRALASWTLSLYLFHFPILWFLTVLLDGFLPAPVRGLVVIAATLALCYLLSRVTEAQKSTWRAALTTLYGAVIPRASRNPR